MMHGLLLDRFRDEWVHGLYNLEVQDKTSLITISEVNNVSAQDTHT